MKKVTLYQLDSKNRVKVWSIEVLAYPTKGEAHILSHSGLEGGAMTPDTTIIKEGKNAGKANETTYHTQAIAEAEAKVKLKVRQGYTDDKSKITASHILGSGVKSPMLAQKYDPTQKQSNSKSLKTIGVEGKIVMVQRKKDGNRCNIKVNIHEAKPFTRKGDELPTNGLEHILESVLKNFQRSAKFYQEKYGVTEYVLDGELFTKAFSFNKLNGLAKKETKTAQDLKDCKEIKYHLYDVMIDTGYETRYKVIQNFKSPAVHIEEAIEVVATEANILTYLEMFLTEGEEGLMMRQLGVPYENKRTWQLCKYKVFEDAEFEIVGFEESVKGGMAGNVICKMTKPTKDRAGNLITTFKAGLKFSHEECAEFWNNQSKYIGKLATIEFFGVSEYNVPRFGKAKELGRKI